MVRNHKKTLKIVGVNGAVYSHPCLIISNPWIPKYMLIIVATKNKTMSYHGILSLEADWVAGKRRNTRERFRERMTYM
jgi:hypothetical protein